MPSISVSYMHGVLNQLVHDDQQNTDPISAQNGVRQYYDNTLVNLTPHRFPQACSPGWVVQQDEQITAQHCNLNYWFTIHRWCMHMWHLGGQVSNYPWVFPWKIWGGPPDTEEPQNKRLSLHLPLHHDISWTIKNHKVAAENMACKMNCHWGEFGTRAATFYANYTWLWWECIWNIMHRSNLFFCSWRNARKVSRLLSGKRV